MTATGQFFMSLDNLVTPTQPGADFFGSPRGTRPPIASSQALSLVQTGTTGHIDGLIHQAGLSHARPSTLTGGVSTETSLDALEIAISATRGIGAVLA
jgi:hypothetical protein